MSQSSQSTTCNSNHQRANALRSASDGLQGVARYQLIAEVKIRRESFGGILYKYGCADRGALSFINSPSLIELLITSQQHYHGDVSAAVEQHRYSVASKQKIYSALDDLVKRGYLLMH